MGSKLIQGLVGVLFAISLNACGGGDGNDDGPAGTSDTAPAPISVTFDPAAGITETFDQNQDPATIPVATVNATFAPLISGPVFPVITLDKPTFDPKKITVVQTSGSTFKASFVPDPTLAAGVYSGTMSLKLCKDQACTSQYSLTNSTLAYKVTVNTPLVVTMKVDGVLVPFSSNLTLQPGQTVELDSNRPLKWSDLPQGNFEVDFATAYMLTFTAEPVSSPIAITVLGGGSLLPGGGMSPLSGPLTSGAIGLGGSGLGTIGLSDASSYGLSTQITVVPAQAR